MKKSLSFLFICCTMLFANCSSSTPQQPAEAQVEKSNENTIIYHNMDSLTQVLIVTSLGDITIALYDNTPAHRDNFLRLVKDKFYDGVLFHRIIQGFMIQTGDPESKHAVQGQMLGMGGPDYRVPAEFHAANYHKRGAVAAARDNNPQKASSGSQFYIVDGRKFTESEMRQIEMQYRKTFTAEQKAVYMNEGGAPFLDMDYTVFGEVVSGMEVVDKIAEQAKDRNDRPLTDVKIISATIIEP